MSLLTKVFTAAASFCLALWLISTSEVFRVPTGETSLSAYRDLSECIKKNVEEEASNFFEKLPGPGREEVSTSATVWKFVRR